MKGSEQGQPCTPGCNRKGTGAALDAVGKVSTRKIQDYMILHIEAAGTLVPELGAGSRESQIRDMGPCLHETRDSPPGSELSVIGVRTQHEDPSEKGGRHSTRSQFL